MFFRLFIFYPTCLYFLVPTRISANNSVQPFDPTIRSNHSVQPFDPTILSNHSVQPFGPTIQSNHSVQPFSPTIRSNHSVQPFGPTIRSNHSFPHHMYNYILTSRIKSPFCSYYCISNISITSHYLSWQSCTSISCSSRCQWRLQIQVNRDCGQ